MILILRPILMLIKQEVSHRKTDASHLGKPLAWVACSPCAGQGKQRRRRLERHLPILSALNSQSLVKNTEHVAPLAEQGRHQYQHK